MTKNIGTTDRAIRFAVGALLILLALTGVIGAWGWIGVVPLATAFVSFCPAYRLLGMNTCGIKKAD
ncbi:YgaP family membrane protein [Amaricoccus macauensis]|uniref:YgaP family membrane protein n=1 Tax=Amaricoccus macauensis TaxID=57001 RepID=UPI003C7AA595